LTNTPALQPRLEEARMNLGGLALCLGAYSCHAQPPVPTQPELFERRQWVAAKFGGAPVAPPIAEGLEVHANHGPVQVDARGGRPLRLGATAYSRGLYCHAPSHVAVRLPRAGARFEAHVGVDSNDQTSGGRGSVVFVVRVGGAECWRSAVLREGMAPVPVPAPLGGATEFELLVEPTEDGYACDQADWADARVLLADGTALALGDLPLYDRSRAPYSTEPWFSFTYDGRRSRELLDGWTVEREAEHIEDPRHGVRTRHTVRYTDPVTRLEVRCVGTEYHDFPTVEWTLYLRNGGDADTPLISDVRAIDTTFERSAGGEFVLHRIRGDDCTPASYQPLVDVLAPGTQLPIANTGGRPTQLAFPYFNLEWPGAGLICVLSWAGQWSMGFERDAAAGLRLHGGQEVTRFRLHPGEEVRSPLVVLQFYQGDWVRAQNVWRRWMLAHNLPQPGAKPLPTQRSLCTGNFYPGLMTVADQERAFLQRHRDEGVGFDVWWQDAGWYPCDGVGWPKVGTWEPDPVRFPRGLRELSDLMHDHGKRAMVWFEPERVHPGTWVAEQHPEWVHGGAEGGLLKLSEPACREWLTDHIDRLLTEQGLDDYRQDFNIDPLPYWRAADAEDRQGITEIRHVEGYFAYWDELLRRHPNMLIDSCASGGRRNDLETLRRAVPLLRSDWYWSPEGQQRLTYGLSLWFPYQGTGVIYQQDAYWWRSSMVAEMSFGPDAAGLEHVDFGLIRRMVDEHRTISPYFLGDFYPLTPYAEGDDVWTAWQFDRPDLGGGVVQVFRRAASIYESAQLKLRNLDPVATYRVRDLDSGEETDYPGASLMTPGVRVALPQPASSAVVVYEHRGRGLSTGP
jgi:alpha-galactosidase